MQSPKTAYWRRPPEILFRQLNSSPQGPEEVGIDSLKPQHLRNLTRSFLKQFSNLLIVVLIFSISISALATG